jgi:hypothetical protein
MYAADWHDHLPPFSDTDGIVAAALPFFKTDKVFQSHNPLGQGRLQFNENLAGRNPAEVPDLDQVPMLFDPSPFPDGRFLVAFADGATRFVSAEEWSRLREKLDLGSP